MKIFPTHYHEDDETFINKMLDNLHPHAKIVVCEGYDSLWVKICNASIPDHKVINLARKTCNTRLREFVNKYEKSEQGGCVK